MRNPKDTTDRNARASLKRDKALGARIDICAVQMSKLRADVRELQRQLRARDRR